MNFLFVSLLTFTGTAKAHGPMCPTLFSSPQAAVEISSSSRWRYFQQRWHSELAATSSTQSTRLELLDELVEIYLQEVPALNHFADLIGWYSELNDLLSSPLADKIFHSMDLLGQIKPRLQKIFTLNHARLWQKWAHILSSQEKLELLQTMGNNPWLLHRRHQLSESRDLWWRLYWVSRLNLIPETATTELMSYIQGEDYTSLPSPMNQPSVIELIPHHPDIIDSLTALPYHQRIALQRQMLSLYDEEDKSQLGLNFINKLNHPELRSLVEQLESRSHRRLISSQDAVGLMDQYWSQIGYGPNILPNHRGGYSFRALVEVILNSQHLLTQRFGLFGPRPTIYLFGSFPNGRARYSPLTETMGSDVDVSFNQYADFYQHNLRNSSWLFIGDKASTHYRWLLQLEQQWSQILNLQHFNPGQLLSPMTGITPFQLTEMNQPVEGMAYVTLASPIVVEMSYGRSFIHIHHLREGNDKPTTVRFELDFGHSY
jgi:hypothetical protein